MTKLTEELADLGRELDLLIAGDDNRRVMEEVEGAIRKLELRQTSLHGATLRRKALLGPPVNISPDEFQEEAPLLSLLRAKYEVLEKTWKEDPSKFHQSGCVGELDFIVDSYTTCMEKNTESEWELWKESLERQFAVANAQLESVRHVLDYEAVIAEYQRETARFATLSLRVPTDRGVLDELKELANKLRHIREGMIFELPQKVVEFYNDLDRNGQFPMRDIDKEVSIWLEENDALVDLAIVRRRKVRQ